MEDNKKKFILIGALLLGALAIFGFQLAKPSDPAKPTEHVEAGATPVYNTPEETVDAAGNPIFEGMQGH